MKQQFAWAVVERDSDKLAVLTSQCPIFWLKHIAEHERQRQDGYRKTHRVVKVIINEVYKSR